MKFEIAEDALLFLALIGAGCIIGIGVVIIGILSQLQSAPLPGK